MSFCRTHGKHHGLRCPECHPAPPPAPEGERTQEEVNAIIDESFRKVKDIEKPNKIDPDTAGRILGSMNQQETFNWLVERNKKLIEMEARAASDALLLKEAAEALEGYARGRHAFHELMAGFDAVDFEDCGDSSCTNARALIARLRRAAEGGE